MTVLHEVLADIDALHRGDPETVLVNGKPKAAELVYAERMSECLQKLVGNPSHELQIAVRSQHLCRWEIQRLDYPTGRPGYLKWRTDLGKLHADKAAEVMRTHHYDEESIRKTVDIIRKKNLKSDPDAQVMEDCACLVFIEHEFANFAAKHTEDKIISIIQKTWAKMSVQAQEEALQLPLARASRVLVTTALTSIP